MVNKLDLNRLRSVTGLWVQAGSRGEKAAGHARKGSLSEGLSTDFDNLSRSPVLVLRTPVGRKRKPAHLLVPIVIVFKDMR